MYFTRSLYSNNDLFDTFCFSVCLYTWRCLQWETSHENGRKGKALGMSKVFADSVNRLINVDRKVCCTEESWWKWAIWDGSKTSLSSSFFLITSDSRDVSWLFNLPSSLLHLPRDKEPSASCTTSVTQRGTVTLLLLTCSHHAWVPTRHVARRVGNLSAGSTEACCQFCTMFLFLCNHVFFTCCYYCIIVCACRIVLSLPKHRGRRAFTFVFFFNWVISLSYACFANCKSRFKIFIVFLFFVFLLMLLKCSVSLLFQPLQSNTQNQQQISITSGIICAVEMFLVFFLLWLKSKCDTNSPSDLI